MRFVFSIPGVNGRIVVVAGSEAEARRLLAAQLPRSIGGISAEAIQGATLTGTTDDARLQPGDLVINDPGAADPGLADNPADNTGSPVTPPTPPPPPPDPLVPIGEQPLEQQPGFGGGVDIQDAPFATFQNALENRTGIRPEGLVGRTLSTAFDRLNPARLLAAHSGSEILPAIGEDPGALQAFFENRLGQASSLPLNVFNEFSGARGRGETPLGHLGEDERLALIRDLTRAAAANRIGGGAARLLPSNDEFTRRLNRRRVGSPGDEEIDLLDFARQQFGF